MKDVSGKTGFTLIEILIVMSIIALLSGLILRGIQVAQLHTRIAVAKTEVGTLGMALGSYVEDEAEYPARAASARDENDFPVLYEALLGAPRPGGGGGRSAPYSQLESTRLAVLDAATGEYRRASRQELGDDKVEKFFLDPFGSAYVYRPNRGRKPAAYAVHPNGADIYSLGPNEVDDTVAPPPEAEENDDIGNW